MSLLVDPVENFENGKDFFLRKSGIIHNGINIETCGEVKSITQGKIIAYRFSKDYLPLNNFDTKCLLKNHFHYLGNDFFTEVDNPDNNNYKTYFEKDEKCTTEDIYKLKEDLTDYDKIEAFYYLKRIISNSFVLMEYEVTLLNSETFKFYMLYNHLAPMGRLTCSQKTKLPWYESKLFCKDSKYYYVETEENIKLPSELILKTVEKIDGTNTYKISWDSYPGLEAGEGTIQEKYIRPTLTPPETRRPFRPGIDPDNKKQNCLADEYVKQTNGIIVYTTDSLGNRNVRAILDSNIGFDYVLEDLKKANATFHPYKINYNGIEGFIYLNETQKYTDSKDWQADIDKYYNVISDTDIDIKLKTCQLKICAKELKNKAGVTFTIEEDKIGFPVDFEIESGKVIGFAGFNFMKEENIGELKYVAYDKDTKPFDIHIETFVENEEKLKFDYYKDKKIKELKDLEPFFLKISAGTNIVSKKPSCKITPAQDTFDGCIAKVEKGYGFYSDEEFCKVTIYAKAIPIDKDIFVQNDYSIWNHIGYKPGYLNWYQIIKDSSSSTYDNKGNKLTNTISLKKGYVYRVDSGRGPVNDAWYEENDNTTHAELSIRHIDCIYEILSQSSIYYIKVSDYNNISKIENRWFTEKDQKNIVWIKGKLDSTNLFSEISKAEYETEMKNEKVELFPTSEEVIEYSTKDRITESEIWLKVKTDDGKTYWIKKSEIKTEKDATPIELVSYYDWQKIFEKITLKDSKKYIVCEPKKLSSSDKSKAKFYEFDTENKKQALIDCGLEEMLASKLLEFNQGKYYFTHVNEWSNDSNQLQKIKLLTFDEQKIEDSLKHYEFFKEIKGKNTFPNQDSFCYLQPYYFLENLKMIATVKEFNPYQFFYATEDENLKKSMLYAPKEEYWIKKTETDYKNTVSTKPANESDYIHVNSIGGWEPTDYKKDGIVVKPDILDNPGFTSIKSEDNGIIVYDSIFGAFNEDYIDVRTNSRTSLPAVTYRSAGKSVKRHIGIDYYPGDGKKIVSLIHGKIIAKGWITSDGLSLLVQRESPGNRGDKYLYLICHISSYVENLNEGDRIIPGQTVAYTGSSGTKNGNLMRSGCFGAHLHVSVIKCDKIITKTNVFKTIIDNYKDSNLSSENDTCYTYYKEWNKGFPTYLDPFNYNTEYWKV